MGDKVTQLPRGRPIYPIQSRQIYGVTTGSQGASSRGIQAAVRASCDAWPKNVSNPSLISLVGKVIRGFFNAPDHIAFLPPGSEGHFKGVVREAIQVTPKVSAGAFYIPDIYGVQAAWSFGTDAFSARVEAFKQLGLEELRQKTWYRSVAVLPLAGRLEGVIKSLGSIVLAYRKPNPLDVLAHLNPLIIVKNSLIDVLFERSYSLPGGSPEPVIIDTSF